MRRDTDSALLRAICLTVVVWTAGLTPRAGAQPVESNWALDPLPVRAALAEREFDALEARFAAARRAPDSHAGPEGRAQ
jgi:hypothetical protein